MVAALTTPISKRAEEIAHALVDEFHGFDGYERRAMVGMIAKALEEYAYEAIVNVSLHLKDHPNVKDFIKEAREAGAVSMRERIVDALERLGGCQCGCPHEDCPDECASIAQALPLSEPEVKNG